MERSFGTHDGSFHADEVTASALLLLFDLIDREKIVRTRDAKVLAECEYVCDVGGVYDPKKRRFDHHQVDYQGPLSSAGMVWEHLRDENIVDQKIYDYFNHALIGGVDAHDNGNITSQSGVCTFSHIISNFVPISYDVTPDVQTAAFFEALDFAYGHLRRMLERFYYTQSCREKVLSEMEKNQKVLIFEEAMPWADVFFEQGGETHPAEFVIMPAGMHWKLRGIPPNGTDRMKVRHPLPEKWAGLMEGDLKKVTGIEGAIFCHKGRFISVWETKEDALKAWRLIL